VTNSVPLIAHAYRHAGRTAVVDSQGSFSYSDLLNASSRMATALLAAAMTFVIYIWNMPSLEQTFQLVRNHLFEL